MPWFDTELAPALKENIESFGMTSRPVIYELLEKYSDKTVIIFKSREEAENFLEQPVRAEENF